MRTLILILCCLISVALTAQVQSVKKTICSHSWQEGRTSIVWSFRDSGDFSAFLFWAGKKKFGCTAKKGTFRINDSVKTIEMTFDSTYSVYSKDSFSANKDIGLQVWNLVSVTHSKMKVNRPPLWEFERRTVVDGKNVTAILEGEEKKKRRKQMTG